MGKDITKKFTINLEIATKDAEKQVAASADNIKKLLNNAVKDGVNVKELRDMANTINSMFEKIGQAAPLDIDKNFKGNGSATKRIEMLTDALDKLFIALNNVNNTAFLNGGKQFNGLSNEVQNEIQKLQNQVKELTLLKSDLQKASKSMSDVKSNQNLDILDNYKVDLTEESIKSLIQEFDALEKKIQKGNKNSLEYYNDLLKLSNVSLKLNNALNSVSADKSIQEALPQNIYADLSKYALTKSNLPNTLLSKLNYDNIDSSIKSKQKEIELLSQTNSLKDAEDAKNQKLIESYNKLATATKTAYESTKKNMADDATDEDDDIAYADQEALNKVVQDISATTEAANRAKKYLDDIWYDLYEKDIPYEDVLNKLCSILSIEVPGAADKAKDALKDLNQQQTNIDALESEKQININENNVASEFQTITAEANKTSEAVQKVMYHIGNLFAKQGARDTFGDMPENLTTNVEGTKWEKYGFGILGGGLFGVTDPSTITKKPSQTQFIQSIDLNKYNMYMADTEERATALMEFLSKLQKFSMKSALPDYTGFDAQLQGVDSNTLYQEFQSVFTQAEMTKDEFNNFINEMSILLKKAGLNFDTQTNSLDFSSLGDLKNTDNISTRFMKKLGYQGVNVGTTSFDGLGQGSVIFDFNESDIVGYFNTIEAAVRDYQNIVSQIDGQEWVGTSQQLEQYKQNLNDIIDRIKTYRQTSEQKGVKESRLATIDNTLSRLEQARNNIDDVMSGKKISDTSIDFVNIEKEAAVRKENATAIQEETAAKEKLVDINTKSDINIDQKTFTEKNTLLSESAQLDSLQTKIVDIKTAIESKTQAFKEEGDVVSQTVDKEIEALEKLRTLLEVIQNMLKVTFDIDDQKFNNINLQQNKINDETISSDSQSIQQILTQILSVLQGFTGIETDNKDSVEYKESSSEINSVSSDIYQLLVTKLSNDIATETTLLSVKNAIDQLYESLKIKAEGQGAQENYNQLIDSISDTIKTLQNVANGIVEHQKSQKIDTTDAVAKISDPEQYKQISNIAANAVGKLGTDVQVKSLKALADGVVKVEGAFKNASGEWEGFTVNVNESNQAVDLATNKQSTYAKALNDTSTAMKNAKKEAVKKAQQEIKNTAVDENKKLKGAFNTLDFKINTDNLSDEQQKIANKFKELNSLLEKYSKDASKVSQKELNNTLDRVSALQKEIQAYKEKYNISNSYGGTKNAYGKTAVVNAQAKFNTLKGRSQSYIDAGSTVVSGAMDEYEASLRRLIALQIQFKSGQDLTPEQEAVFVQLKNECNEYGKALKKILDDSDKLQSLGNNQKLLMDDTKLDSFEDRASALKEYVQEIYGADVEIGKLNGDATKLTFTIKNGDGTITNMTASLNAARTSIVSLTGDTKKATNMFDKFFNDVKQRSRELLTYFSARFGIEEVFQALRQGITYVKEIDTALTELKKVTDETDETYAKFLETASETSSVIGSTVKDFTNATADFARLGYSLNEASQIAESALIYKNVGDGFSDVSEASESIISTMKAFKIEATDTMSIVDKFNEVGNNFAISSKGIGDALQRSASALNEAGNTIDESIALVTAANSVIQDPEQVGK